MVKPMTCMSHGLVLLGLMIIPTSSDAQVCNGSLSEPIQTAFSESQCPGTLNKKRTWSSNGSGQCNETGTPPGLQTNSAVATMDAKGTCDPNTGAVQCWYTEGTPTRIYGDPAGLSVSWWDGVRVGTQCQNGSRTDAKLMPNIGPCLSSFCCSSTRREQCEAKSYVYDQTQCACTSSPLIVVFQGEWQESMTSPDRGAPFELMPGVGPIKVAWTRPVVRASAFLVRDRNGNGWIDDGSELYGSDTPQLVRPGVVRHGFTALATEDANDDGEITESDPAFTKMALWFDVNHDGMSQPPELRSIESVGVKSISVTYSSFQQRDRHGNNFAYRSTLVVQRGKTARVVDVFDVYVKTAPLDTTTGGK